MKRSIKIFFTLLLTTINSVWLTACVNPFFNSSIFRITIVTDGHTISDQSFNQSAYEGVQAFVEEAEIWAADPNSTASEEFRNKKFDIRTIQPATVEHNVLRQSYNQALVLNSQVVVANGAIQTNALIDYQNDSRIKNSEMSFIATDVDTENRIPYQKKNLAGVSYKAEQSGFYAAIAGAIWAFAHPEECHEKDIVRMSTYGGVDIKAVTNFMYGFLKAIDFLNDVKKYSPSFFQELKTLVKKMNPDFDQSLELPIIEFVSIGDQFTGNFNQGSESSKSLNQALVQKHTDVIFPVAGPQTADTLATLKKANKKGKVIGVDTDQQLQYPEAADYFLTSALKNILGSIKNLLWKAINYDATPEHQKLKAGERDKIFKGQDLYYGGLDFIGIANNKAINLIYNDIISSEELENFAQKVSVGWQEILANNKDQYWQAAKKLNPFN